jgi:transcription elongation factor SPT6
VDILEKDKKDAFSLGSKLIIENQEYDDLDEIIARYIEPIMEHINSLVKHQKFINQPEDEIKRILTKQKSNNSSLIPYLVSIDPKRAGRFNIYYVPGKRVKLEHIGVTKEGFSFLKRNFEKPDRLFNAFKKSYRELSSMKKGGGHHQEDEDSYHSRGRDNSPEKFGKW